MSNATLASVAPDADIFSVFAEVSKYDVQLNIVERLWAVCKTPPGTATTIPTYTSAFPLVEY